MSSPVTSPASSGLPVPELCSRYERVSTAMVNDVLRSRGLIDQTLPNTIAPLRESMRVAGPAFTIAGRPNRDATNDMPERAAMLEAIGTDAVCVWATDGDQESAQWGEVMTMAAMKQGCRGAIIDGGVRDTDRVLAQDFPIFARYRSPNGMLGRFRITGWGEPIAIGGVAISPGDLAVADIDGAVIVPAAIVEEVLLAAEDIRDAEVEIKQMVAAGLRPSDVVAQGGYF